MNRRQKIKKLKHENEFMHSIINSTPEMRELYRAYNEPFKNVVTTTMRFHEYRKRKFLIHDMSDSLFIDLCKKDLERELFKEVKENIEFYIDDTEYPFIEAKIYVGIK